LKNLQDEDLTAFYTRLASRAEAELATRSQEFTRAGISVDRKIRYGKRLMEFFGRSAHDKAKA
jgi:hypothetical protein